MKKIKYIKSADNERDSEFNFKQILKGVIIATTISICLLIMVAILLTYTNISLSLVKMISTIVFFIGVLLGGVIAGNGVKFNGWLHGLIAGGMYVFIIFVVSALANIGEGVFYFPLFKIVLSCALGGVGGIMGVNIPGRKVKRH